MGENDPIPMRPYQNSISKMELKAIGKMLHDSKQYELGAEVIWSLCQLSKANPKTDVCVLVDMALSEWDI